MPQYCDISFIVSYARVSVMTRQSEDFHFRENTILDYYFRSRTFIWDIFLVERFFSESIKRCPKNKGLIEITISHKQNDPNEGTPI